MKTLLFCNILAIFITLIVFFVALAIFEQNLAPSLSLEKYMLAIYKNNANAAFIAAAANMFVYGALRSLLLKKPLYRSSFFVSIVVAIISCAAYMVPFLFGASFFILETVAIWIVASELGEFYRKFIETNNLPKIALRFPFFESLIILFILTIQFMAPTMALLKN